jgi:hypothetical protein
VELHKYITLDFITSYSLLNDPFPATSVITYTDNSSYLLEVRVWEDQAKDWVLFSTQKKVMKEQMDKILHEVMKLGFNQLDILSASYDNC